MTQVHTSILTRKKMVRLTTVLLRRNVGRIQKGQIERKGQYKVVTKSMNARQILEDEILGIKGEPVWDRPDNLLPDFRNLPPEEEDKSVPAGVATNNYIVSNQISFTSGIDQACILTNTQSFSGLPPFVEKLKDKYEIKDQKLRIQKAIMQSQVWNSTRDKLPKYVDLENIGWRYRREFGIPDSKSSSILLENFLHMSGSLMKDFPKALNRRLVYKPEVQTVFKWKDCNIQISSMNECMILSDRMLPIFADSALARDTVNHKLPDMYPIRPTIDLLPVTELQYENKDMGALTQPVLYPQTVFRITGNPRHWTNNQAYNLLVTYGIALAEARQRFEITSGNLPEPVCIQNINITYNRLNFIFFQLNTLDTNEEGVKNIAWLDTEVLFSKTRCKPWKNERRKHTPPVYGDFNPEGFSKFLAVYLNGIA